MHPEAPAGSDHGFERRRLCGLLQLRPVPDHCCCSGGDLRLGKLNEGRIELRKLGLSVAVARLSLDCHWTRGRWAAFERAGGASFLARFPEFRPSESRRLVRLTGDRGTPGVLD